MIYPDGKAYYSFDLYCKQRFGKKIYKVTLPGGVTCPNRDGKIATGGCIFCSEGGSGDFCADSQQDMEQQVMEAKKRIEKKLPAGEYGLMAYFQSFTSTYLPVEVLREKLSFCVNREDITAISLATRPDCLPDEVLEVIKEASERKPLFVELGLQTCHEKTAELIRIGYKREVFEEAVEKLSNLRIPVVVHVILGLPGENKEMCLETIRYINSLNDNEPSKGAIQGVKLQLLHVLKGTELYAMYERGEYEPLSFDEYIDLVKECVAELSDRICIHRLTGDGPKKLLIAPLWSGDKKRVLNTINNELRKAFGSEARSN